MKAISKDIREWISSRIKPKEIQKYLRPGSLDFIDENYIESTLRNNINPKKGKIREILAKALEIKTLTEIIDDRPDI